MKVLITTLFLASAVAFGQQVALNSQYMFNESSLNPAASGTMGYTQIHLNGRKQWSGFGGSPSAQTLTANGYLGKNISLGGGMYNDVTGESRRTGFMIMSAYRLRMTQNNLHFISGGMGLSFTQHYLDVDDLYTFLPEDPALAKPLNNQFVPDANMGLHYTYAEKLRVGFSIRNVIQSNRDLFDFNTTFVNPMVRNYFLYSSYNFDLKSKWQITPTALVRVIDALAYQFDVSTIATYNKLFWFGFSYRHNDALAAMAGAQFGAFKFGYSYDYTLSDIRDYSAGSHEIFLELRIFKASGENSSIPWLKRNRIYGPTL